MSTTISFVENLVRAVPELKSSYEAHRYDNDTLLPHVFMGDVARFAIAESNRESRSSALSRLLHQLEMGLETRDDEVCELIGVSFVENLCGEADALRSLEPLMGPSMKKEMVTICGQHQR